MEKERVGQCKSAGQENGHEVSTKWPIPNSHKTTLTFYFFSLFHFLSFSPFFVPSSQLHHIANKYIIYLMFLGMLGQKLFDVFFLFWRTGRNLRVSRCTRAPRLRGDCEHNSTQRGQRQVVRRHGFSQNLISGTHSIVYEDSDELRAGFYWPSVCRNICTGRQGFGQRDEPGKVMGGASRMFIVSSLSPLAFLRSH